MVIGLVSLISLLARHFMQYACISATSLFGINDKLFLTEMPIVTETCFGSHIRLLSVTEDKLTGLREILNPVSFRDCHFWRDEKCTYNAIMRGYRTAVGKKTTGSLCSQK